MRTVAAALTAVSQGRFDELAWIAAGARDRLAGPSRRGRPDPPVPTDAIKRSNESGSVWLADGKVSVSALVEEGDRVVAHIHSVGDDEFPPPERFLVAEVHDGQITSLRGYATETEARDALARPLSP